MPLKIDGFLRIPQSDMEKVKIKFNQPSRMKIRWTFIERIRIL